jgi:hypothetical protein
MEAGFFSATSVTSTGLHGVTSRKKVNTVDVYKYLMLNIIFVYDNFPYILGALFFVWLINL